MMIVGNHFTFQDGRSRTAFLWQLQLRPRPHVSGYFWIRNFFFPNSKISPSTRSVFKSNSPVHTHPVVSGFTLEKPGLHVVPPYWFIVQLEIGHDFATSWSDSKISGFTVHALSDSLRIFFFHSGERIKNYPDSLPNSPDACGRKLYPERKSCGFKKTRIRARVDGA